MTLNSTDLNCVGPLTHRPFLSRWLWQDDAVCGRLKPQMSRTSNRGSQRPEALGCSRVSCSLYIATLYYWYVTAVAYSVVSNSFETPTDCSPPGSSVHGISQARKWSGSPFPSPGNLPDPGQVSCIGRLILYHGATGEAQCFILYYPSV